MTDHFEIAILGAGPAGLGAATNAARHERSHILIEQKEIGNTVYDYQLRKHVMAEPDKLPLRACVGFEAGTREEVLEVWNSALTEHVVNVVKGEVTEIKKLDSGGFEILYSGSQCTADKVVLAIGMQGTPRKLGVPGEELPHVAYTLADPDAFQDMDILVVGAGDAAIENALGLCDHNRVSLLNRGEEFPRAKDANAALITKAIQSGRIQGLMNSDTNRIEEGKVSVDTPDGLEEFKCDHVIARIGAVMPRRFLEACGIEFPNENRDAVPVVSANYESNVPGLHIIGALIGYPLIKQCINQGYEVIEHIIGNEVEPADQVLIEAVLESMPGGSQENLETIRAALPLFKELSDPQYRELVIDSKLHMKGAGDLVFKYNDYTDSFFSIVSGAVTVELPDGRAVTLTAGSYFGEGGLLSGRRRNATVRASEDAVLLETPRKQILKLINSLESVKAGVDRQFIHNILATQIFPEATSNFIDLLSEKVGTKRFKKNEVIFSEGDVGDLLYVIRKGSVKVSRLNSKGIDVTQTYIAAGNIFGEMALLTEDDEVRTATITAAVPCEVLTLEKRDFQSVLQQFREVAARIKQLATERSIENVADPREKESGAVLDFVVSEGITDAENVLVIDSDLCIACDNCEAACAATHGGYSRLDRKGGTSFASIQVPISCRHCENPLCMLDCPPDALERQPNGEVIIKDSCIGCGNCVTNCPYDVIQMVYDKPAGGFSLFNLLKGIFGSSDEVEENKGIAKAGKCDMCKDLGGGPACVRACPTGAAMRIHPKTLLEIIPNE